jgi:PKHD-type hydroxylase
MSGQHLPLWYIGSIPVDKCEQAILDMQSMPAKEAVIGIDGETKNTSYRDTEVRFAPKDYWLADVMQDFASEGNKECKWDYEITARENVQLAKYGTNQHYKWHTDTFALAGKPLDRKLTVIVVLNDEFEGGEFQVRLYQDYTPELKKGSVLVIPSILEHQVLPVIKGVRYSAVLWLSGPRFR